MAGLQAALSDEFLRHFMPETIFLVEGDAAVPARDSAPLATAAPAETTPVSPPTPEPTPTPKPTPAIPKIPKEEPAPGQLKYKVLGENRKGVVVLVTLPDEEFVTLPQLDFLQKILGAIGLLKADVAYVNNLSGETAQFEDLQQELEVGYIISFASRLDTALPHDKFTLYNPVRVGSVPVVFSHALKQVEQDVAHKKQLWGALQKVFL